MEKDIGKQFISFILDHPVELHTDNYLPVTKVGDKKSLPLIQFVFELVSIETFHLLTNRMRKWFEKMVSYDQIYKLTNNLILLCIVYQYEYKTSVASRHLSNTPTVTRVKIKKSKLRIKKTFLNFPQRIIDNDKRKIVLLVHAYVLTIVITDFHSFFSFLSTLIVFDPLLWYSQAEIVNV